MRWIGECGLLAGCLLETRIEIHLKQRFGNLEAIGLGYQSNIRWLILLKCSQYFPKGLHCMEFCWLLEDWLFVWQLFLALSSFWRCLGWWVEHEDPGWSRWLAPLKAPCLLKSQCFSAEPGTAAKVLPIASFCAMVLEVSSAWRRRLPTAETGEVEALMIRENSRRGYCVGRKQSRRVLGKPNNQRFWSHIDECELGKLVLDRVYRVTFCLLFSQLYKV